MRVIKIENGVQDIIPRAVYFPNFQLFYFMYTNIFHVKVSLFVCMLRFHGLTTAIDYIFHA